MKLISRLNLLILFFILAAGTGFSQNVPLKNKFAGKFTTEVKLDFLTYLPENFDSTKEYPLILFLHGSGERGNDIEKVRLQALPKEIEKGRKLPAIVIAPQCPENQRWKTFELAALLDHVGSLYKVDKSAVYVTGLSMGGSGTWRFAAEFPERVAAIIPMCAYAEPHAAYQIADIPVWVFHGTADDVTPVDGSERMVKKLQEIGGNVKFTKYEGANHGIWERTYANDEIYTWLFSQRKK
jgi:predicted peptidase